MRRPSVIRTGALVWKLRSATGRPACRLEFRACSRSEVRGPADPFAHDGTAGLPGLPLVTPGLEGILGQVRAGRALVTSLGPPHRVAGVPDVNFVGVLRPPLDGRREPGL
jgi:hypothetical protein